MTLNLEKYLNFIISKQMAISHFDNGMCHVTARKNLDEEIKDELKEKYGEDYLGDANYLIFFRTVDGLSFKDKEKKKLYRICDSALGKNANNISQSDIKSWKSNCVFVKLTLA